MKKSISLFLSVIIFLTLSLSVFAKTQYLYPSYVINENDFYVIAHRGLNSLAPENTLSAFRLAGEFGFWGCEFDIYPTTDGKWMVMHDPTIDRMTNGSGSIMTMTSTALSSYRIDKGTNIKKYPNERIPELSQVLDICSLYGMHPVIEVKGGDDAQIKELCSYLSSRSDKQNFIVTSFSNDSLKSVRKYMSDIRMWFLTFEVTQFDIAFCRRYGVECIDSNITLTSEEDIAQIMSYGFQPGIWTADTVSDMEKFYSYGVRYITTNDVLPAFAPENTTASTTEAYQNEITAPPETIITTESIKPETTVQNETGNNKETAQVTTTAPIETYVYKETTTNEITVSYETETQIKNDNTNIAVSTSTESSEVYHTNGTIDEYLSEDSRATFKIEYKAAKKLIVLFTNFFIN